MIMEAKKTTNFFDKWIEKIENSVVSRAILSICLSTHLSPLNSWHSWVCFALFYHIYICVSQENKTTIHIWPTQPNNGRGVKVRLEEREIIQTPQLYHSWHNHSHRTTPNTHNPFCHSHIGSNTKGPRDFVYWRNRTLVKRGGREKKAWKVSGGWGGGRDMRRQLSAH